MQSSYIRNLRLSIACLIFTSPFPVYTKINHGAPTQPLWVEAPTILKRFALAMTQNTMEATCCIGFADHKLIEGEPDWCTTRTTYGVWCDKGKGVRHATAPIRSTKRQLCGTCGILSFRHDTSLTCRCRRKRAWDAHTDALHTVWHKAIHVCRYRNKCTIGAWVADVEGLVKCGVKIQYYRRLPRSWLRILWFQIQWWDIPQCRYWQWSRRLSDLRDRLQLPMQQRWARHMSKDWIVHQKTNPQIQGLWGPRHSSQTDLQTAWALIKAFPLAHTWHIKNTMYHTSIFFGWLLVAERLRLRLKSN